MKTERLKAILQGAFSGPPTPLNDIPKRAEKRGPKKVRVSSDASAKNGQH
jgi:hypothetical protein